MTRPANDSLIVLSLMAAAFLLGVCVGRFSLKRELRYLRNFKANRDRLDRITRVINA